MEEGTHLFTLYHRKHCDELQKNPEILLPGFPLHYACYRGNYYEIRDFLQSGTYDVNEKYCGYTPLAMYLWRVWTNLDIVQMFLAKRELQLRGLDKSQSPTSLAVAFNSVDVVRQILNHPRVKQLLFDDEIASHTNQRYAYGLLMSACIFGRPDMVEMLLSSYTDTELNAYAVSGAGYTCLTYAITRGYVLIIQALRKFEKIYQKLLKESLKPHAPANPDYPVMIQVLAEFQQVNALREMLKDFDLNFLQHLLVYIANLQKNNFSSFCEVFTELRTQMGQPEFIVFIFERKVLLLAIISRKIREVELICSKISDTFT